MEDSKADSPTEEQQRRKGVNLGLVARTRGADALCEALSHLTGPVFCSLYGLLVMLWLPILCVSFLTHRNATSTRSQAKSSKTHGNLSIEQGGSRTAIAVLSMRATAASLGHGTDHIAPLLMAQLPFAGMNVMGTIYLSQIYQILTRAHFRLTSVTLNDFLAKVLQLPIGECFMHSRTCFMDDTVTNFVHDMQRKGGTTEANVVMLGAGYDTRLYRLHCFAKYNAANNSAHNPLAAGAGAGAGVGVGGGAAAAAGADTTKINMYEVDAHGTQLEKRRVLLNAGIHTDHVTFVTVDFAAESWLDRLQQHGFDASLPTCFIWEGITYYLTEEVLRENLAIFQQFSEDSVIGLDYFGPWCREETMVRAMQAVGEPWHFYVRGDCGPESKHLHELLHERFHFNIQDNIDHVQCINRYVPQHLDGRPIGHLGNFGGFVSMSPARAKANREPCAACTKE